MIGDPPKILLRLLRGTRERAYQPVAPSPHMAPSYDSTALLSDQRLRQSGMIFPP